MNKKVFIWGAGKWGDAAYHYYKNDCEILGYIDSVPKKWGMLKNGIKVYSPDVLKEKKGMVIIAVKRKEAIVRALKEDYGIKEAACFGVYENAVMNLSSSVQKETALSNQSIILFFGGGLGNQMFQYALMKNYLMMNKNVYADLDDYILPSKGVFELTDVFRNIHLSICSTNQKKELIQQYADGKVKNKFVIDNKDEDGIDEKLLEVTAGIIKGLHQNYYFASLVRKELLEDFSFNMNTDERLRSLCEKFQCSNNMVAVHIRRGDYLSPVYYPILGDVCTEQYYSQAMAFMEKKVKECRFCFFSDDILWVKDHFPKDDAIYIDAGMFGNYQNWYDMCLMSCCAHNIIANSTFSWWGAWLNRNSDKIVIAPQKWSKTLKFPDICPPDWIRM